MEDEWRAEMNSEEYFVRKFRENFFKYKDRKMVIYGTSIKAEYVLRSFPEFNIVGVMDEKKQGRYKEKNIISIEQLEELEVEIIVLVSRNNNIPIIVNRLYEECVRLKIMLFSINGRNAYNYIGVNHKIDKKVNNEYTEMKMKEAILSHDSVVFELLNTVFASRFEDKDISVFEDYRIRNKVAEFIKYAETNQKSIYFVVSNKEKHIIAKRLIEKFLQIYYLKGKFILVDNITEIEECESLLYIGSKRPQGLERKDYFILPDVWDMIKKSNYYGIKYSDRSKIDNIIIGEFVTRVFNNPFCMNEDGRIVVDNLSDFTYCFIAPMVTYFILFLIENVDGRDCNVLFASRDGFLLRKLYRLAVESYKEKNLPQDYYFYTSRLASITATIEDERDLFFLNTLPIAYDIDYMTEYRFCISNDKLKKYDENIYPTAYDYMVANKDLILENSRILKKNYNKYIEKSGLDNGKKNVFVDLVSSGTCQMLLDRLCNLPLTGLYMGRYETNDVRRELLPIKAMYNKYNLEEENYWEGEYLFEHYWFLEKVMTSFEASLHHFDENGNPVFTNNKMAKIEKEALEVMQNSVISFFKNFLQGHKNMSDKNVTEYNYNIGDELYRYTSKEYTIIECEYLKELSLFEDLGLGKLDITV